MIKLLMFVFVTATCLYIYLYTTHNVQSLNDYNFQKEFIIKLKEQKDFALNELLSNQELKVCFIGAYSSKSFLNMLFLSNDFDYQDRNKIKTNFNELFANTDSNWWILTFNKDNRLINTFRLNRTKFYPNFSVYGKSFICVNTNAGINNISFKDKFYEFNIQSKE